MAQEDETTEIREPGGKVRLYVTGELAAGEGLTLSGAQTHYLLHVMRAKAGQRLSLFNGRHGEWLAAIVSADKRGVTVTCVRRTMKQAEVPDLWLLFAPIKKIPSDYLTQKATELGVSVLQPVITRHTIVSRVNTERMTANAVGAAEQSGRLSVPQVREPVELEKILAQWPTGRRLYFCDEDAEARPLAKMVLPGPAAILTGPEGGFHLTERARLRTLPFVTPVTLGPRILRADTAALAALSIWQSVKGDWV